MSRFICWRATITGIADAIAVGVGLRWVRGRGADITHIDEAIVVGVGGLSLLIADVAALYEAALFGLAALWLAGYGVMRLRSAIRANAAIKADAAGSDSLAAVLTTGAVLTFGNPHVYLDTVVLLGAVSVRFTGMDKLAYGTGAATASFVFFFALGYGASLLAPQMQRPNAWRVLDTIIAVVMFALAIGMARAGGWLGA